MAVSGWIERDSWLDETPQPELLAGVSSDGAGNVLDACEMGLLVLDQLARVVHWNSWLERAADQPRTALLGRSLVNVFPELAGSRLIAAVDEALGRGASAALGKQAENDPLPLYRSDDERSDHARMRQAITVKAFDPGSGGRRCLVQVQDITGSAAREIMLRERTRKLEDSNRRIRHLTNHDDLTGLPNRASFKEPPGPRTPTSRTRPRAARHHVRGPGSVQAGQ